MKREARQDQALITTFGRLVEAQTRLGKELGEALQQQTGLSHAEFEVLLRVSRAEGGQISMGALAGQVALTSGGITKLVDRLIAAGLLQRVPCATDRRVSFAALTRTGAATLGKATRVHGRNLQHVFAAFDTQQLQALDDLLDLLRTAELSDVPAAGGPGRRGSVAAGV